MSTRITRSDFRTDPQGRVFADLVDDAETPFDQLLKFFNDAGRQQRMEDAEFHHDRAPLAGVVRDLESVAEFHRCLSQQDARRAQRVRQAIGIMVRMVMEQRGWRKTGERGSLGVRAETAEPHPVHNERGLALWFARGERYEHVEGMPYESVRERAKSIAGDDAARQVEPT